ncbi:hypothetical protein ACM66B_003398 [Microbotryomycetes sp. NB124-2]
MVAQHEQNERVASSLSISSLFGSTTTTKQKRLYSLTCLIVISVALVVLAFHSIDEGFGWTGWRRFQQQQLKADSIREQWSSHSRYDTIEHELTAKQAQQLWDGSVLSVDGAADFDESDVDAHARTEPVSTDDEDDKGTDARGCTLLSRQVVANASSWTVKETEKWTNLIQLRDHVHVPIACTLDALFSVRLVHGHAPTIDDSDSYEIVYSSPLAPMLVSDRSGYTFNLTVAGQILPASEFEIQVELDFGSLPGVADEGSVCGESESQCDVDKVLRAVGRETKFVGDRVEFEFVERSRVWLGQERRDDSSEEVTLCDDLSDVQGYWTGLVFNVVDRTGKPCRLVSRQDPMSDAPSDVRHRQNKSPLWLHFVGDSNTRNAFTALVHGLGAGPYGSHVVHGSSEHNGSIATVAYRSLDGFGEEDGTKSSKLDLILTWAWWHQDSMSTDEQSWDAAVFDNAAKLYNLTSSVTLSLFCSNQNLKSMLDRATVGGEDAESILKSAETKTPDFVYVSLGSHAPEVTASGQSSSFDVMFGNDWIQQQARREGGSNEDLSSRWRFFTVTDVSSKHIPFERWPHQDLVRNNHLIKFKNDELKDSVSRLRDRIEHDQSVGGDGRQVDVRLLDIASLTRGLSMSGGGDDEEDDGGEGSGWMKVNHKSGTVDALHFRQRVYREWSRFVWTDVVRSMTVT